MNGDTLEKYYKEGLEERIIAHLAKVKNLTLEQAMDIYYSSQLAQKIHDGKDDVQYLDYKVLVQILLDTEPELFEAPGGQVPLTKCEQRFVKKVSAPQGTGCQTPGTKL